MEPMQVDNALPFSTELFEEEELDKGSRVEFA
jgi:hypothetical protein